MRWCARLPPEQEGMQRTSVHEVGHFGRAWVRGPARASVRDGGLDVWLARGSGLAPDIRLEREMLEVAPTPLRQYPLFYYRAPDDSCLVVCSQIAPMLPLVPSGGIDKARLVAIMAWALETDPAATPYRNIRRVRPCELIRVGLGGFHAEIRLPRVSGAFLRSDGPVLAKELRARLEASVEKATRGARHVVVNVSGGVDSSGVLALAAARCRRSPRADLTAISHVFASPGDDRPHLATLEAALGLTVVRVAATEAAPWFVRSLVMDAQPGYHPSGPSDLPVWAQGHAAGADVALAGTGGDRICGRTPSFAPLLMQGHPLQAILRGMRIKTPVSLTALQGLDRWVLRPSLVPLARRALPAGVLRARRLRRYAVPWMSKECLVLLAPMTDQARPAPPRTPDEHMALLCRDPVLEDLGISWGQMASVTSAAPVDVFRDPDLVEFVARVDPMDLSYGDAFRGLYRLAMKDSVPESILTRQDKAHVRPAVASAALAAGATELLTALSSVGRLADLGLVDAGMFRPVFARWFRALKRGESVDPDPTDAWWGKLWSVLAVEAFLRSITASPEAPSEPCDGSRTG